MPENPLEKDVSKISLFGFKMWCDTCNRLLCETRKKYNRDWEESGEFKD